MKIKLRMDEYYRVFIARNKGWGYIVEVPEPAITRFQAADKEFREAETALYEAYKAARDSNQKETDASPNL